jgi:hypothetical protein
MATVTPLDLPRAQIAQKQHAGLLELDAQPSAARIRLPKGAAPQVSAPVQVRRAHRSRALSVIGPTHSTEDGLVRLGACGGATLRFRKSGCRWRPYDGRMARCTAPVQGHRTASGAAACPVHGGGYGSYRSYGSYSSPSSYSSAYQSRGSGGGTSSGGGSVGGRTRPRWSPSSSSVTYTSDQVRALTPYRRTVESRGQQPELRDLFRCHAWDDRRGVATELNDLLEAQQGCL